MKMLAAYRDLFANRPLIKLLGGEFVSAIGDWLYIVALLVVIYSRTGSPFILGVFGAARVIPYIVLSVPAGWLADRVDRRMILLVTDLARGACMLAMAAVIAFDGPIAVIVGLSILASTFSTFFYPAIGAYLPNLVRDERQLGPANSAWASLDNLGFVIGPMLGGLLLAAGGTTFAFLINAATFIVIAAVLWTLPPSRGQAATSSGSGDTASPASASPAVEAASPGAPGGAAHGATVLTAGSAQEPFSPGPAHTTPIAARPAYFALVGLVVIRFVDYAIAGGVGILTVILATDILSEGPAATGYLNAAIGVGGVVGALVSGILVLRRTLRGPVFLGSIVIAVGALVLGVSSTLFVAMAAIILVFAGHLVLEVIGATLLQRVTTDAIRGRAVGALMSIGTLAEALGSLTLPVLVVAVGLEVVLPVTGILMIVATIGGLALLGDAVTRPASPFEATIARVAALPLFAGVPSAALERALGRLTPQTVAAGEVVVRQGDPANRFYIIERGTFVVRQAASDGTERELRRLGPDAVFGELGLLHKAPRSATVEATSDGLLLVLDGPDFLALVAGGRPVRGRLLGLYEPAGDASR